MPQALEHLAMVLGCIASWEDERLLRRPQKKIVEAVERGCSRSKPLVALV
jgi:hypothetical protein